MDKFEGSRRRLRNWKRSLAKPVHAKAPPSHRAVIDVAAAMEIQAIGADVDPAGFWPRVNETRRGDNETGRSRIVTRVARRHSLGPSQAPGSTAAACLRKPKNATCPAGEEPFDLQLGLSQKASTWSLASPRCFFFFFFKPVHLMSAVGLSQKDHRSAAIAGCIRVRSLLSSAADA